MQTKAEFDPKRVASEVHGFVQDAVGDIANDMLSPYSGFLDDDWKKRINKAKKNGVQDVLGWLADELYNDSDTIQDLMGDRICDATNGDKVKYQAVLDELSRNCHTAMKKACEELRRE